MAEMIVSTPDVKRLVNDYDFVFDSGMMMPVTIDLAAGDTIVFNDVVVKVRLSPKPSVNDPSRTLPEENITIFVNHLISVQHREREVVELSPEQKFEWHNAMVKGSGTIQ